MTSTNVNDRDHVSRDHHVRSVLAKVPEISLIFWAMKLLTTGMGEAISDSLGQTSIALAAGVGIIGMAITLRLQLRQTEYKAPYYWATVMMIAVFGTMGADAIHDGVGIGYGITTPVFALLTALVFWRWYRVEGTLDFHAITTLRRERFYWLAVLCTFALGTAAGDLTSQALNWGFWPSALIFAGIFTVPAIGWYWFNLNPVLAFWACYIVTRPLGASFADGFSKTGYGGLRLGDPLVAIIELAIFVVAVTWIAITKIDVQPPHELAPHAHRPHASSSHEPPRLGLEAD